MNYFKTIFQAAVISGALALGAAATAEAAPLAQAPTPATAAIAEDTSNVIDVRHKRRYSRWCARNPRACNRRYAHRRYYHRRHYPGYAYYPRHHYPRYYGYPYGYGYYGAPRVGLWFSF
jgi:hypothetical protein